MSSISIIRFGEPDYVELAGVLFIVLGLALFAVNAIYGEDFGPFGSHAGEIHVSFTSVGHRVSRFFLWPRW